MESSSFVIWLPPKYVWTGRNLSNKSHDKVPTGREQSLRYYCFSIPDLPTF